jgi:hypothetical protein
MRRKFVKIISILSLLCGLGSVALAESKEDFKAFQSHCNGQDPAFVGHNGIINRLCMATSSKTELEDQLNYVKQYCFAGSFPESVPSSVRVPANNAVKDIVKFFGPHCDGMLDAIENAQREMAMYFAGAAQASCNKNSTAGKPSGAPPVK